MYRKIDVYFNNRWYGDLVLNVKKTYFPKGKKVGLILGRKN